MSEDLEALLREHYRRAAEGIVPDAELVERGQRAVRPTRARTWPRVLAAAAAIAVIAAVTWGLLHPTRRDQSPATPPVPVSDAPSPTPPTPRPAQTPTPRATVTRPLPSRSHPRTSVRPPSRSPVRAVPTPTSVPSSPRSSAAP